MPDKKPKKETNQGLPLTSTQANNMMITGMGYNATTDPSATWYYPTAKPPSAKPSFGTNMRDFATGSQERADEYTKRGWAQDATTAPAPQKREKQQSAVTIDLSTFAKGAVPMSATSDFTKAGAISTASGGNTNYAAGLGLADTSGLKEKASFTAPAPTLSKKEARQEKRAKRLEGRIADQTAKGKTAVSEGRFIDAGNKQGRVQNLQKRVDRLRK
jgi:hypothetical protein